MKTLTFRRLAILIVLSILIFIAGVLYILNNGNPYTNYFFNEKMPSYLEEKGYSDEDIQSQYINTVSTGFHNKDYYSGLYRVVFKDELNTSYYYAIKKKGKSVAQLCEKEMYKNNLYAIETTEKTKHSENNCIRED